MEEHPEAPRHSVGPTSPVPGPRPDREPPTPPVPEPHEEQPVESEPKPVDNPDLPPEGDPDDSFEEEPVLDEQFDNPEGDETADNAEVRDEPNDLSEVDKEFSDDDEPEPGPEPSVA
jgi:hypothetical protein